MLTDFALSRIVGLETLTLHFALTPLAFAVIVAVPFFFAVITPLLLTAATDLLLLVQVTFLLEPFTVAEIFFVQPFTSDTFTGDTLMVGASTLTVQTSSLPRHIFPLLSARYAVIFAVPLLRAVILPLLSTLATLALLDFHLIFCEGVQFIFRAAAPREYPGHHTPVKHCLH